MQPRQPTTTTTTTTTTRWRPCSSEQSPQAASGTLMLTVQPSSLLSTWGVRGYNINTTKRRKSASRCHPRHLVFNMVAELRINNWATTSESVHDNWATTSAYNAPVAPREATEGAQWATTSDSRMFWLNVCHLITSAHHPSTACSTALQQRQKAASVVVIIVVVAAAAASPAATTATTPKTTRGR